MDYLMIAFSLHLFNCCQSRGSLIVSQIMKKSYNLAVISTTKHIIISSNVHVHVTSAVPRHTSVWFLETYVQNKSSNYYLN